MLFQIRLAGSSAQLVGRYVGEQPTFAEKQQALTVVRLVHHMTRHQQRRPRRRQSAK